jgi:hypothetical protein
LPGACGTCWSRCTLALGPDRAGRLAELAGPLFAAALGSGLLPGQTTLGIATVPYPSPR